MKKDRRKNTRVSVLSASQLQAEIRASQNHSQSAKVLNLSRHGALLELDRRLSSHFHVDESVSIKLRFPHDVVWVAGVVRHCYGARLGVFFPAGIGKIFNKSNKTSSQRTQPVMHHRAPKEVVLSL